MTNSKLGLGFMRHSDLQESQKIVDYAMTHNCNYFETSPFYINGRCENYVYTLLQNYSRNNYEICGKMPIKCFLKTNDFKEVYEKQLKMVPGNYFDVYLLQSLDHITAYTLFEQNIIPFFLEEKKKGNIKKLGFSSKNLQKDFQSFLQLNCWDIVQIPLNFFLWQFEETKNIYALAKQYNLEIIAQAPLMGGKLPVLESMDFIKTLDVNYCLIGTADYQHFIDMCDIYNAPPIDFNYNSLNEQLKQKFTINCCYCNKCFFECDYYMPIMTYFKLYNDALQGCNISYQHLTFLKKNDNIIMCNECKHENCSNVCPNSLNIKLQLQNINTFGA